MNNQISQIAPVHPTPDKFPVGTRMSIRCSISRNTVRYTDVTVAEWCGWTILIIDNETNIAHGWFLAERIIVEDVYDREGMNPIDAVTYLSALSACAMFDCDETDQDFLKEEIEMAEDLYGAEADKINALMPEILTFRDNCRRAGFSFSLQLTAQGFTINGGPEQE